MSQPSRLLTPVSVRILVAERRGRSSWMAKEEGGGDPLWADFHLLVVSSGGSKSSFLLTVGLALWPPYCPREGKGG